MSESDCDTECDVIYRAYEERRLIETVFRYHKGANRFDETRVRSDHQVMSSEFVCFLSTVITSRLLRAFSSAGLLDDVSYGGIMRILERAKKVRIDSE